MPGARFQVGYIRSAPPWWVGGLLVAIGCAIGTVVALIEPIALIFAGQYLMYLFIFGFACWIMKAAALYGESKAGTLARQVDLDYHARLRESDLAPYRGMPLFRLTEGHKQKAADLMTGTVNAREIQAFRYHFVGRFRPPVEENTLARMVPGKQEVMVWPGKQTLIITKLAKVLPNFHVAPKSSDWAELATDWSWAMLLGDVLFEFRLEGCPTLLSGSDEESLRWLFRRDIRNQLGRLRGWTLECIGDYLMCYIDNHELDAEELGRALYLTEHTAATLEAAWEGKPEPEPLQVRSESVQSAPRFGEKYAIKLDRRVSRDEELPERD